MLDKIRTPDRTVPVNKKILCSVLVLVFGVLLGTGSKALDQTPVSDLPYIFAYLDITNFLGRFSVWIFIAVCISVYSSSAIRASLNVFLFFIGMVSGYYVYCAFVAGFFPKSYAMIWFFITLLSPVPAFFCWYAKGKGWFALVVCGGIIGTLFSQAVFLFQGIRITYLPEVIVWLASILLLKRSLKETAIAIGISIPVALILQLLFPFWG